MIHPDRKDDVLLGYSDLTCRYRLGWRIDGTKVREVKVKNMRGSERIEDQDKEGEEEKTKSRNLNKLSSVYDFLLGLTYASSSHEWSVLSSEIPLYSMYVCCSKYLDIASELRELRYCLLCVMPLS